VASGQLEGGGFSDHGDLHLTTIDSERHVAGNLHGSL
jgi:hypothetical protein